MGGKEGRGRRENLRKKPRYAALVVQIQGLGYSETARRYAIVSLDEARAYLEHPVLGPRLRECTRLVCQISGKTIREILGYPDDMKFRSCMTLFAHATADNLLFEKALEMYFSGEPDTLTLRAIRA